jgi:hypothetical protein
MGVKNNRPIQPINARKVLKWCTFLVYLQCLNKRSLNLYLLIP